MTKATVQEIRYRFNPQTRQVEIVQGEKVLEVTTLALAADRVSALRNEAAQGIARIDSSPYKSHNRPVA